MLAAAVDGVRTAVGHLVKVVDDGGLGELDAVGLVGFLAELEQVRNTWPVVDRAAIQFGVELGVPAALTERSMTRVLVAGLRLSVGEAHRRVRAAEHLAVRRSMTGEPLGPVRPVLAAAQAEVGCRRSRWRSSTPRCGRSTTVTRWRWRRGRSC